MPDNYQYYHSKKVYQTNRTIRITLLIFLFPAMLFARDAQDSVTRSTSRFFRKDVKHKGELFIYWGYNRGQYTNSDIHFQGADYNFTLYDVHAVDKPEKFDLLEYAGPTTLSIPQYNFGFGYYLSNHFAISFNVDHMKYVMVQDLMAQIVGEISPSTGSIYAGTYNSGDEIKLTTDFLKFEHTDGLNYLNIEGSYLQQIYGSKNGKFDIEGISGLAVGVMMPKSNVTLLNYGRNDQFHFAGYGVSGRLAVNFVFFKRVYLQANLKGGYTNLPDIVTRAKVSDRADQHFMFMQENVVLGVTIPLIKRKK